MRVLVGCEYSGRVRQAFRALGHDAWSCDLLPSDDNSEFHVQGDVLEMLDDHWDLGIFHPPCTYLTCSAEWAYKDEQTKKIKPETLIGAERRKARDDALVFVTAIWNAPIEKLAIENPVGVINTRLEFMPKPQWIQQYQFGENASKKTGLWMRGLNKLTPTNVIPPRWVCGCGYTFEPGEYGAVGTHGCPSCCGTYQPKPRWANQTDSGQNREPPGALRWKIRSYTPQGIALAMADQWG
jgi:hypothetical protein